MQLGEEDGCDACAYQVRQAKGGRGRSEQGGGRKGAAGERLGDAAGDEHSADLLCSCLAIQHLLDSRQLPIYVHCLDGQSVSTLLIAILRKVQAWSMRAIVDEISRNLGYDEEVIQYQTSFVEKYGKPEWVRLPPRRFLPDWIWNDPSPLKRLKDPYDVLVVREKTADRPTTSSGALANGNGGHPHVHKRQASGDDFSSTSTTNSTAQSSPSAPTYGVGSLPVQHPTLRIRFDLDADLPPPLALPLASQSLHSRENSSLFSPSSSRPSSRAGRTNPHGHPLHAHQHNSEVRSSSRPGSAHGSPRRRGIPMDQLPPSASPSLDLHLSPPSVQSEFVGSRLAYGSTQSDGEEPAASYVRSIDRAPPTVPGRRGSVGSSTPTRPSLLSNSATPRASSLLLKTVRPVSLRGAVHGLGLHGEELEEERNSEKGEEDNVDADDDDSRRSESPTAHLSAARQQLLSEDGSAHRPMMLERSVSENAVSAPCAKDQTPGSPSEDEYFSDPEEDKRRRREGESRGRDSSEQARRDDDGGNEAGDEDEHDEDEGEGEEEEEEEEEEDEEEEENDSDGEDDGLALEALDLEGY